MIEAIRRQIEELVSRNTWEAGLRLLNEGAVLDVQYQPRAADARVANESGSFERVRVSLREEKFSGRCSCRQVGPLCSHAVAVLLRVASESPEVFGFQACFESGSPPVAAGAEAKVSESARPVVCDGARQQLMQLVAGHSEAEASLKVFLVDNELAQESRWQRLKIRTVLRFNGREYSPSNVRKLVDSGCAAGGMIMGDFRPQERQIMRFLTAHAELVGIEFPLAAAEAADFFHCLIGFDGIEAGSGPIHIHAEHVEPLLVACDRGGKITVTSRLMLPDRGLLPAGTVYPIAGRGGVWIGVGGHYWWLPGIVEPAWLRFFLRSEPVSVSAEELERLTRACERGGTRARIVPADESAAELSITPNECKPVLTLDWENSGITAVLEFEYRGVRVASDVSGPVWHGSGYLLRDSEVEHEALTALERQGFTHSRQHLGERRLEKPDTIWHFLHEGHAALCSRWKVYTSNEFQQKLTESGQLSLNLETSAEDMSGWFELQCRGLVNGTREVAWDEIAEACRHADEFLMLEDGSVVRIDEEVRRVIELLLRRAFMSENDRCRFRLHDIFSVGEAVAPYFLAGGNEWEKLRDMLIAGTGFPVPPLPKQLSRQLRDYQHEGIGWLHLLEQCGFHGILADEMGLGKTIQALGAVVHRRMQDGEARRPSLVVCPTSLIENWLHEAKRFAPKLKSLAVRGLQRRHLIARLSGVDLAVTSYALLRRDIEDYSKIDFDYLILDEAQHIKNPDTANARTCKCLNASHRLILTGTPLENSVKEVWSLFHFLLPGLLGTQKEFRKQYCSTASEEESERAAVELGAMIKPFILRRTKDQVCKQLPPKIEQVVYCHLDPRQQKLHHNLLAAGREMVRLARENGWSSYRFELLSVLMRLRQLCCHPLLLPAELRGDQGETMPSAKTELVREIILEAIDGGHRILLFSQFTSFLKLMLPWLKEEKIAYEYLDGATKDRQMRVDRFNADPSIPIFLLSLKAGGTGLNLTGADTVIHYDQWWNPMVEDQATDRTHRIGQVRPVTIYKLIARHSIEEKVVKLQENKRRMFTQVMAGAPARAGELTAEDFEYIFGDPRHE